MEKMRYSNLHTHTTFSDGVGSVKQNVESAISKNMCSLGFSDHSFTACDPSYCMHTDRYKAYIDEVNAAKKEYEGTLPIFLGLEKDYYSEGDDEAFDYVIASAHYINRGEKCYPIDHTLAQQQECVREVFGGNVVDMAKYYFEMMVKHVEKTKPTFIGHFDVVTKFSYMPEEDEGYQKAAQESLFECLKTCKYLEFNTGGISRGYKTFPYPNKFLLEKVKEYGGKLLLGSDSHDPRNLDFFFDESVKILKSIGFETISVFNGKEFEDVKI